MPALAMNPQVTMIRLSLILMVVAGSAWAPVIAAQDNGIEAGINLSIRANQELWTGQQVTVNLDLKTTGLNFSNTHFSLPEVSGAFLMQTDSTTVKLTETINGQSWQIIRYPLALYPQQAGELEIPTIAVRFSSAASFASKAQAFEFHTRPLRLTIKSPPGIRKGDLVVSTRSFELEYSWQPESEFAQAGDAFTLTVIRHAADISSMLLPPLPVFRTEGLAAYPQAPEITDKSSRGELTGERIDTTIWVAEDPGSYEIPGIRFQWWDPQALELKQRIIPGRRLDISPLRKNPAPVQSAAAPRHPDRILYLWLLLSGFVLMFGVFLWRNHQRGLSARATTEKSAFAALLRACKSNQPAGVYAAVSTWVSLQPVAGSPPVTLEEFSSMAGDPELTFALTQLQEALVKADNDWQGNKLKKRLQAVRRRILRQAGSQRNAVLPTLNP